MTIRVFYYQWTDGTTKVVCVYGPNAGARSPIWNNPNTCSWIVPGTLAADD